MDRLGLVTVVVRDYDEALRFYVGTLGFRLVEDTPLPGGKRWVTVGVRGGQTRLLLAQAKNEREAARIGDQTGGRVFLFLHTCDFAAEHARLMAAGVTFREEPRRESYGVVAVFEDLYGNLIDLIEDARQADA